MISLPNRIQRKWKLNQLNRNFPLSPNRARYRTSRPRFWTFAPLTYKNSINYAFNMTMSQLSRREFLRKKEKHWRNAICLDMHLGIFRMRIKNLSEGCRIKGGTLSKSFRRIMYSKRNMRLKRIWLTPIRGRLTVTSRLFLSWSRL